MKKFLLTAAAVSLAFVLSASVALAAAGTKKAAKPKIKADILAKYDKNKNGVLDRDEKVALEKDMLPTYDLNKDGALDDTEKKALYADIQEKGAKKKKN